MSTRARKSPLRFSSRWTLLADTAVSIYGTEVFEVNEALRDIAIEFASTATLNDTETAQAYRARYEKDTVYAAGAQAPSVLACDVATSDVYYSGTHLGEAFDNVTTLLTNGSGIYCSTAQEDNASLEVIMRATVANLTDYSRVIVMRTASDFDRPPPGVSDIQNLFYIDQGGFPPAILNIYLAGVKVVLGILDGWESKFAAGIAAPNYLGDMFATLGGTPDFGLPADLIVVGKRDISGKAPFQGNLRMRRAMESGKRRATVAQALEIEI